MKIRFLDLRQVTEDQLRRWNSWLTPERRQRMEKYRDFRPHLCGEGLAREMLTEELGSLPQGVMIGRNENGKPLTDGVFFNISHSGDLVLCAVSDRPVGVDVERLRPVPARLAERFGTNDPETFFRLWTQMEARIKCRGVQIDRWREYTKPLMDCREEIIPAPEGYVASLCEKIQ